MKFIKDNGFVDNTTNLVEKCLNHSQNDNDDITVDNDTLSASLICPISHSIIQIPARFTDCQHVSCFDFVSYLRINKNKISNFKCPICPKTKSDLINLIIDKKFLCILKSLCGNCDTVELDKEMNFRFFNSKEKLSFGKNKRRATNTNTLNKTIILN